MPVNVLVDSNFLMVPAQFRVSIYDELDRLLGRKYDLVMLSPTHQELRRIAREAGPKESRQALFALKQAEKCKIVDVKRMPNETIDELILRHAKSSGCAVATNDRELRKKLKKEGIPTIFLRERSHLEAEGLGH